MLVQKDQLDLETRAHVEAAILQLSAEPSALEAAKDKDAGVLRLAVPETSIQILYQIDEEQRRILLLSLKGFKRIRKA
jgi:hypothetical protein